VLKNKNPDQLFPRFCQQVVRYAPKQPRREKTSHAKRKTDQLHNSTSRNYLAIPDPNKIHSFSSEL
jgi:hypothetical protein